jgi:mercuric ion binding protein
MKTKILLSLGMLLASGFSVVAQDAKTEKFEVKGNCGMCETRIEKAAKSVDGVSSADWDKETKFVEVSFDPAKTDLNKIHMAIAKAGHDTELHKSSKEVYDKLPGCCKYDREEAHDHSDHDHGDHDGHGGHN